MAFRARKVVGTFVKRAPDARGVPKIINGSLSKDDGKGNDNARKQLSDCINEEI